MKENEAEWDIRIEPKNKLLDINFKEIWDHRDLMFMFVKRDLTAQYKQTVLGPLWHFIQPVFTTIVYMLLFTTIARLSTDGLPPLLFYLSGITIWNYFSACFMGTSGTFATNAGIFGKVYFPRLVMPLATIMSNVVKFLIQFSLLILLIVYYDFHGYKFMFTWNLLLIPYLLLCMAGLGLGWGIIVSSLTIKYRDLSVLVSFGLQLLMYATPVIFPLSALPAKYHTILQLNPLASLVETFRYAMLGVGSVSFHSLLYSSIFTVVTLILGIIIFNKVERTFIDTI